MTRILDLQRRLREVGRIRIGHRVATPKGGTRPAKLDRFRLTSRDERVIAEAAAQWGGTAERWPEAPDGPQWQVTTDAQEIAVIVPPSAMAFTQAYEQWTAGGCHVRCDGQWDSVGDAVCHCDPSARECAIHTRLSLLVPDLSGLGVWRLDTQGYNAAVELAGVVDVILGAAESGRYLPARLRLEQRSRKRIEGEQTVTLRFAVPVLDLDMNLGALFRLGGERPEIPVAGDGNGSATGQVARLTPVPDPDPAAAFVPSVSEQIEATSSPSVRDSRRITPPPATGLAPRTAYAAAGQADEIAGTGPAVLVMRTTLNMLGKEARAAFLDRFGAPPQDLPTSAVPAAEAYVRALVAERSGSRPSDGRGPDEEAAPPTDANGDGAASAHAAPDYPPPDEPHPEVADVARKAQVVFRAEYDAAPRGDKTRVVDRLRHALTYAVTGKASLNECDPGELVAVWMRLADLASGRMSYTADEDGVRWEMGGPDGDHAVTVQWAQVEGER